MGGEIRIGGLNLLTMPGSDFRRMRRSMGVLFQDGAMLGALTLAENVCLPLSEHLRLTKQELRTEAIRVLRMVGLGDFADYYPNELSGGMRKHYPDMTIVVVSHDLASLKRIADQVLVLRDGVSLYCGDLNGLEKSQDPYLVQFLHREPGPEEEEAGELMQPSVAARLEAWRRR